jgi:predicted Zn finger-like uncharacterized protein
MKRGKMIINITCPNCNFSREVPSEKIPAGIKHAKCPRCSKTFEIPLAPEEATPSMEKLPDAAVQQETTPPLPDRITDVKAEPVDEHASPIQEEKGYFASLYRVFTGVLFSPTEFFRNVKEDTRINEAMIFGILTGSIGTMFRLFWEFYFQSQWFIMVTKAFQGAPINNIFMGMIIFSPLIVFINILVVTAMIHTSLIITGGATKGFDSTMKVILYSNAASVFSFFPYLGDFVAFVLSLVIIIKGIREVHETSNGRAIISILLPVFFLLVLSAVAITILAGSII